MKPFALLATMFALMVSAFSLDVRADFDTSTVGETETQTTTVLYAWKPSRSNQPWMFDLATGRSLRVSQDDQPRVAILRSMVGQPRFVEVTFTDLGNIDRIESLIENPTVQAAQGDDAPIEPAPLMANDSSLGRIDFQIAAMPTSPLDIFTYFKSFGLRRGSQCFHRAYYWNHQLWRTTGMLSHKIFMFFTGKYRAKYSEKWWFHVAPLVYEKGQPVVIDASYMKGPATVQEWTNNFLRNDPVCPLVTDFKGQNAQMNSEYCYVIKAPGWYYHPTTIEKVNKGELKPIRTWDRDWLAHGRSTRSRG